MKVLNFLYNCLYLDSKVSFLQLTDETVWFKQMSGIYVEQPDIKQKTVSTERAQNSLWLVKVPKYVAERLQKCDVGSQFGVIQTQRTPVGPEVR